MDLIEEKRYSVADVIGMALGFAVGIAMIAYIIAFGAPGSNRDKWRMEWQQAKAAADQPCLYTCRRGKIDSHRVVDRNKVEVGGERLLRFHGDQSWEQPLISEESYLIGTCGVPKDAVQFLCPQAEAACQH